MDIYIFMALIVVAALIAVSQRKVISTSEKVINEQEKVIKNQREVIGLYKSDAEKYRAEQLNRVQFEEKCG